MSDLVNGQHKLQQEPTRVLIGRRLMACAQCGWVHYAMTIEEKLSADAEAIRLAQRYRMNEQEVGLMESARRVCLRCESPAMAFRPAAPDDVAHAEGHIVTPIYVESDQGDLN
jgi:hypothetical protein